MQRTQLKALLTVPAVSRQTILAWLRQPPGTASPANFHKVIERLEWIRSLSLDPQVASQVHHNRLQQMAREGAHTTAQRLVRFHDDRRDATLVAFLLLTAEELTDAALDMHERLMGQNAKKGERKQEEQIKKSRKAINEKVRLYARVGKALITAKMETQDAYQAIEAVITWERFVGTVEEAEELSTTTEVDTAEQLIVAWSPGGRLLASASYGSIQVWEAESGTLVQQYIAAYESIFAVAWSFDGRLLAFDAYSDKSVHIWEPTSGKLLRRYKGNSFYRPIIAWSPDGRLLTSLDGRPQVWDPEIANGAPLPQPTRHLFASQRDLERGTLLCHYKGHKDWIAAVAWSPDGRLLASASYQTGVQVWEAGNGKLLHRYEGHTEVVLAIAWSPDGQQLASASDDKSVQVWEATSGTLVHRYEGHTEWVHAIAWSPDGRKLASASDDKSVQVWEAASGTLVHRYEGHTGKVKAVAWSRKGRELLASASDDKSVQVWEPASGKLVYRREDHTSAAVAWSPDRGLLASTSYIDGWCVQVWEATGKVLLTYRDHSAGIGAVAWSPGGKRIASAGYEVRIWVAPH